MIISGKMIIDKIDRLVSKGNPIGFKEVYINGCLQNHIEIDEIKVFITYNHDSSIKNVFVFISKREIHTLGYSDYIYIAESLIKNHKQNTDNEIINYLNS